MTNLPKSASPSEPQPETCPTCHSDNKNERLCRYPIEGSDSRGPHEVIDRYGCEACNHIWHNAENKAAEPRRDAPDSINYLEIHHTDGRVKVWYADEAQGRFKGIDHDPTTKEEWKQMAGEGVRTIEALTANSGERQAEREEAMDAIERVIEMADSYKTASQMTLSDARNALKYFRASAAPLKQTDETRALREALEDWAYQYPDQHLLREYANLFPSKEIK